MPATIDKPSSPDVPAQRTVWQRDLRTRVATVGMASASRLRPAFTRLAVRWAAPRSPMKVGALILAGVVFLWLVRPLPWSAPSLQHSLPWQQPGSALALYYQAALDISRGHSPYGPATAWIASHSPADPHNLDIDVYTYPPFLAVLLVPLTALPLSVVAVAWELLAIGCALYLAICLARLIAPGARGMDRMLATAVVCDAVLLFGPLRHSMRGAQIDIELIALLVAAWSVLRSGRSITSGLLLGLAIAIKPTYLLLLGFHLWRREWRAAGAALVAGGIGLALPFLVVSSLARTDFLVVSAFWANPAFLIAPKSISAFGVLGRAFSLSPVFWRIYTAPYVSKIVGALVGLGIYLGASRFVAVDADRGSARWDYAFGLAVLVMLLGSPLTEDAHLALALIPLAIFAAPLVSRLLRGQPKAWLPLALGGLFFLYVTLPVRGVATFSTYTGWRVVFAGYWFYGLAGLAALYVWAGRQSSYRPVGPSAAGYGWQRIIEWTTGVGARWGMVTIAPPPIATSSPEAASTPIQSQRRRWWRRLWPESGAVSPIPALDGLRAVAVILVMLFHAWSQIPGLSQTAEGTSQFQYPISYGRTGVQLFFVLSGFLLFLPYARWLLGLQSRPSTMLFYKRRALRVGPAYWVSLVILVLAAPLTLPSLGNALVHAVFLSNVSWATTWSINSVYWTMAVEVQFYVLLPLFGLLAYALTRRTSPILAMVLVVVGLSLVSILAALLNHFGVFTNIPVASTMLIESPALSRWVSVFAVGMACSVAYVYLTQIKRLNTKQGRNLSVVANVIMVAGLLLGLMLVFLAPLGRLPLSASLIGWSYGALLFGVLFGWPFLGRTFASRVLRFIGLISYSVYIWHNVVLQLIEPHLVFLTSTPERVAAGFVLDVLFSIPVAYASYLLTERPFFAARKKSHETSRAPSEKQFVVRNSEFSSWRFPRLVGYARRVGIGHSPNGPV